MGYEKDRRWSDKYIKVIKGIVGPHLLEESSFEVDAEQAADLVVFTTKNVTIACRIRRAGYAERYPWEFTIRSKRDSGAKTELEKITDGWGDWMLYGHVHAHDIKISRWFLLDLNSFRAHISRDGYRNNRHINWHQKSNGDGTYFVAFDIRDFVGNPKLIIASSHDIPIVS